MRSAYQFFIFSKIRGRPGADDLTVLFLAPPGKSGVNYKDNTVNTILYHTIIPLKYSSVILFYLDLQEILQEQFSIDVSIAAIKRARKQLGWIRTGPRNVKVPAGPCQDHATIVACLTHITEQQQLISQKLDRLENRLVFLQQYPNAYQLFPPPQGSPTSHMYQIPRLFQTIQNTKIPHVCQTPRVSRIPQRP